LNFEPYPKSRVKMRRNDWSNPC